MIFLGLFMFFRSQLLTAFTLIFTSTSLLAEVPAINTLDKSEVTNMYRTYFCPADYTDPEWNGRVVTGDAGTINPQYIEATINRLNFMRALAGLPGDITPDSNLSSQAQRIALMLAESPSQGPTMLHDPLRGGTDTITDNRAGKYFFPEAVDLMKQGTTSYRGGAAETLYASIVSDDNGAVFFAGDNHVYPFKRKILLSPQLSSAGVGTVQPTSWIINENGRSSTRSFDGATGAITTRSNTSTTTSENPILWPPAGNIPYVFIDENWSATIPGADMRGASVTVTGPEGQKLPIRYLKAESWEILNHAPGDKHIDTLAWMVSEGGVFNLQTRQYTEKPVPFGQPYVELDLHVSIQNILLNGSYTSLNYTIHQYNPHGSKASHRILVDYTPPTTTVPNDFDVRARMFSAYGCLIRLPQSSFKLFSSYPEVKPEDTYKPLYLRSIDNNGTGNLGAINDGNVDGTVYNGIVSVQKADPQGQYRVVLADHDIGSKPYLPGQFEVESETIVFSPALGFRYADGQFLPTLNDTYIPAGNNSGSGSGGGGINQNGGSNGGATIDTTGPMCTAKQKKKCKRKCKRKKRKNPKLKKRRCVKRCKKRKCSS